MQADPHTRTVVADELANLVQAESVHRDIYTSDGVFAREMESIFKRTWVYVAHGSELPAAGDYKTTHIGNEPVIVVRDKDGAVNVLANRCRHRGAAVCQSSCGSTSLFRCNFHGWSYDLTGRLMAASYPDGYADLDKDALALESPWKVESYRGFIFANADQSASPLRQYLGPAAKYIDRFAAHIPGHELRVTRDAHRLRYAGNWKLQLENSMDGYHANFTHKSFFALMQQRTAQPAQYVSAQRVSDSIALQNGHAVLDQRAAAGAMLRRRLATLPEAPPAETDLASYFGIPDGEAVYNATPGPGFNLAIFPNLALVGIHVREIRPISASETEVILRPALATGVPDVLNRLRLRYHELFYGPCGFGQPDDLEMFDRVRAGLDAGSDPWIRLNRGLNREIVDDDGNHRADITDETPQRGQYRQWRRLMSAG